MKQKFINCSSCNKPIPLDEVKYKDDHGGYLCEECFNKIKAEKEKETFINEIKMFEPNDECKTLPNRSDYNSLSEYAIDYLYAVNGSDLHLKSKTFPVIRKSGKLYRVSDELLTNEDIVLFASKYYEGKEDIRNKITTVDYSFFYKDVRFRSNFFHDDKGSCLSLRLIKLFSVDFDVLGLPQVLKSVATRRSGMILVTGPTGSGKTTSLAALINYLNHHTSHHILTLEDPIEYIHENKGCLISQREIGRDCTSYYQAIIELLREDPDIIMIGEMRDKASIEAALHAVETGHIVFSTLHTRGVASTITRIVDTFPAIEQDNIRSQLASCLLAICSQQLVPSKDGLSLHLATELMINTSPIAASIRGNKLTMIPSLLQMGLKDGMHTMAASLDKLLEEGKIDKFNHDNYMI